MTKEEAYSLMKHLEMIFDIVRLVDVTIHNQYYINKDNQIFEEPYRCYAVWNKQTRCENCISAKALIHKSKYTKFEFIDNEVYHVIAMYIEIEETPYILEMVSKTNDEVLFGAYGKDNFVEAITHYNKKMYLDPLTKAYNRQYYKDFLLDRNDLNAVAIFDIDDFKMINDTYGHRVGDVVLKAIVSRILHSIRSSDFIVRYGGDEFLIFFNNIKKDGFCAKLEFIRKNISELIIEDHPQIHISISVGGIFGASHKTAIYDADHLLYLAKAKKNTVKIKEIQDE